MPRVAYPNEVGITDPNIIEVRISTALTRRSGKGPSGKNVPTDHILKVRHRTFGWLSPWEWGMLSSLKDFFDKTLDLVKSFLRTEAGVIIFTLTGTAGIIYIFYGEQISRFIFEIIGKGEESFQSPIDALKEFFQSLIPQLPGFPDIPPFEFPTFFGFDPGALAAQASTNFIDAITSFLMNLLSGLPGVPSPPVGGESSAEKELCYASADAIPFPGNLSAGFACFIKYGPR